MNHSVRCILTLLITALSLPLSAARISIVFTDLGHDVVLAKKIIASAHAFTLAVFPDQRQSSIIAELAYHYDKQTLIYLSMEPGNKRYVQTDGMLLIGMPTQQVEQQLLQALDAVPHAAGLMSHMGSAFLSHKNSIHQLLTLANKHRLLFLDSKNSASPVPLDTATALTTAFYQRDVFLDTAPSSGTAPAYGLNKLISAAKKQKMAIGVLKSTQENFTALESQLSLLSQTGTELVPLSELRNSQG